MQKKHEVTKNKILCTSDTYKKNRGRDGGWVWVIKFTITIINNKLHNYFFFMGEGEPPSPRLVYVPDVSTNYVKKQLN